MTIPALTLGLFMLLTAIGLWRRTTWAVPMGAIYAAYVPVNLVLWSVLNSHELVRVGGILSSASDPATLQRYGILAMLAYATIAIATTTGQTWLLWRQQRAVGAP